MGGTAKRKRRDETKGRARATEGLPAEELLTDSGALDQIQGLLASRPWDREAVEQIAALVRETGREVEYQETGGEADAPDEFGTYDAEDEGWIYGDEDADDEPAQLVASAYARLSRIAGADDPLRQPAPAPEPEGKCPNCGKPVWDQAGTDQRLNKCWGCNQRFDTVEKPATTIEPSSALREDYLEWSGGSEPETTRDIFVYVEAAMPSTLGIPDDEATRMLTEWMRESG